MATLPGNDSYPPGFSAEKHAKRFGPPLKRETMVCSDCHGSGHTQELVDGEYLDCPKCDGTGEVEVDR